MPPKSRSKNKDNARRAKKKTHPTSPRVSSTSTGRTSTCSGGSCPTGPRCVPAASPATTPSSRRRWPRPSRTPARWRCSRTSPASRSSAVVVATAVVVAIAATVAIVVRAKTVAIAGPAAMHPPAPPPRHPRPPSRRPRPQHPGVTRDEGHPAHRRKRAGQARRRPRGGRRLRPQLPRHQGPGHEGDRRCGLQAVSMRRAAICATRRTGRRPRCWPPHWSPRSSR